VLDHPPPYLKPRTALRPPTPDEAAFFARTLNGWGIPLDEHEEYLEAVAALVQVALDAWFADQFKVSQSEPIQSFDVPK
jgi:hypothetical protein